jgi:hypothetical protein
MWVNVNRRAWSNVGNFVAVIELTETPVHAHAHNTIPFTVERAFDSARERHHSLNHLN